MVSVHPEWSRNPFHDKPEVGLADIVVELQSIRDMLKPAPAQKLMDGLRQPHEFPLRQRREHSTVENALEHAEHLRLCRSTGSDLTVIGEMLCTLQAEIERLQAKVADQALTIGALKDGAARTAKLFQQWETEIERSRQKIEGVELERDHAQKLLSEERSLTAATAAHTTALERKVAELQEVVKAWEYTAEVAGLEMEDIEHEPGAAT